VRDRSRPAFVVMALAATLATAARADSIDPCSLLSESDRAELGVPKDAVPSHEAQPGGVQACRYPLPSGSTAPDGTVAVILSQGVPERALQLRALQAKAREEGAPAQQQARGEYFEGEVMCKVASSPSQQISQCLGASEQSVVGLAVTRPNATVQATYPGSQLRITATLVSRVASKGG